MPLTKPSPGVWSLWSAKWRSRPYLFQWRKVRLCSNLGSSAMAAGDASSNGGNIAALGGDASAKSLPLNNYSLIQEAIDDKHSASTPSDLSNIVFLFCLYMLQGIPLGLTASLPLILSARNASYSDQGTFSLATWPFSMKLLWAPVVDSLYIRRIGRRKSWLVPIQYLIGLFMFMFADYVHQMLENQEVEIGNDIYVLTSIFFLFTFLAATQDIAVDGWGLTILSKKNIFWASICNNAGSTTGVLIGNSFFLVLESTSFCNDYIRPILGLNPQKYGLVTLKEFMEFFGFVFVISTTLILLFKHEKQSVAEEFTADNDIGMSGGCRSGDHTDANMSIVLTFRSLWSILKLAPIQKFLAILFTCKIAFATQAIRSLKMIEAGVPKEKLALINAPFQCVQILTPLLIGKLIDTKRPLDFFLKIYPIRMGMTIILAIWVYYTPLFRDAKSGEYPISYFVTYVMLNSVYAVVYAGMALTKTSFFTRISDKAIGGTYMTLLNTIANIGNHWPATLALYMVDLLSYKSCSHSAHINWKEMSIIKKANLLQFLQTIDQNTCSTEEQFKRCIKFGARCLILVDAFYFLTLLCSVLGLVWLMCYRRSILSLQTLPKQAWKLTSNGVGAGSSMLAKRFSGPQGQFREQ